MKKDKLYALKEANTIISRKIRSMDFSLNGTNHFKSELMYQSSNAETSLNIYSIKGGQKSESFIENEFQRMVCIKGEIKITLPKHDEEVMLTSSNTMLIPPQTEYTVETIKDSDIIVVFKPRKGQEEKIMVLETIYNKQN